MYRLGNYLDLGAPTTPGDVSLVQLTMLLGLIDGPENTLFVLVKRRNRKNHFSVIIALSHPSIVVVFLEKKTSTKVLLLLMANLYKIDT